MDIATRYRRFAADGSTNATKLGWHDETNQYGNFDILLSLASPAGLQGRLVHDAGCGYGDLYPRVRDLGASYIGTDFLSQSVDAARQAHPDGDFRVLDLLGTAVPTADVTIVCGTLAFYPPDDVDRLLANLWERTRETLAFVAWWNLAKDHPAYRVTRENQRVIENFVRRHGSRRDRRLGYGPTCEAAFAVYR